MRNSFSLGLAAGVLAIGMSAAPSFADVKVNDNLTLSGFLDMSASGNSSAKSLIGTFDQFEVDFMFKYGENISARADIAQGGVGGGQNNARFMVPGDTIGASAIQLEQAFVTYSTGGLSLSAGRFLSASGFEGSEPTTLYQYSTSLLFSTYGGYITGANATYTLSPMISVYGALVASEFTPSFENSTDFDLTNIAGEAQVTLAPVTGVTVKAAYLFEDFDVPAGTDYFQQVINVWGSYAAGPLLVGAEVNELINFGGDGIMGTGGLVMANYKVTDKIAATARFSALGLEGDGDPLLMEATFSPSYSIAGNWWVLAEARYDLEPETFSYALETTFTF